MQEEAELAVGDLVLVDVEARELDLVRGFFGRLRIIAAHRERTARNKDH